ncbi:polyprenol phosphomannose-dependent alpha 1,6 mannosyltransferase MptB [Streptosporangium sp. 'caverna']|uniref:polyprenol phosphomannose-dependent alpha 1,6 mannosyltransferase MptB n=1 Tax=Streptosporangium sp. 'caverna' TaxID=2202249 RepID=UPI0019550FCB|nr:polyprenol phosphomannose-dependent alpha 1,6 mannosyltransferase MptB [Streptosporangium sp. 'caverna']
MTWDAPVVDERRSPARGTPRGLDIVAFTAIGLSAGLTILIGLLGPSAMVPRLAGPSWQPPFSLDLRPDGHLVIAMAAAAIVLGGLGLAGALRSRWRPDPRWLLAAGCVVAALLAFLPPSGSADHLNYAAYGRLVTLGQNPYAVPPTALPADPVTGAVEEWAGVTSVYGPVATAVQALASLVGGDSVRLTILVMALVNAAAFIGTALLLHRFTQGDADLQRRAALLWAVNPLMIYHLSAGMHVDTLAIACMVAALMARGASSGLLLGVGIGVKLNAGLVALGPAWELRRSPGRLAVVAGTATATVLVIYGLAGSHVLDQVGAASKKVSLATPWQLAKGGLQTVFGPGAYSTWIQVGSLLMLAGLAWLILRALPGAPSGDTAPAVAAVMVVAWLFAAPYALPWYDGLAFALLAMASWPVLEGFMVARVTILSLGYLPAREALRPEDLLWLKTLLRERVVPWSLLALTLALVWWAVSAGARARRPSASAAPPP